MNRNYKIIITVLILLLLISGLVYYLQMKSAGDALTQSQSMQAPASLPTDGPSLPSGSYGKTSESDSDYHSRIERLQNVLKVEDGSNISQIKNSYSEYVNQDFTKFKYDVYGISDPFAPSDKNINLVPIDTFLGAVGAGVNAKVKNIAGKNYYALLYCINDKKEKEYGFVLDMNEADFDKTTSNIRSVENYMRQWEPYMLKDLHNMLFPAVNFSENDLNRNLAFENGQFRFAEVDLPSGKSSINYRIVASPLNLIVITTSPQCVDKAIKLFEALD